MTAAERVVLLSEDGNGIGAAAKDTVHTTQTPLHLAFSCYVFDAPRKHLLVTRRSLHKRTWPGTWTNAFCGHPQPFEPIPEAVHRRGDEELGIHLEHLSLALGDFRYRAVDASGVVENEICPVYTATISGELQPHPAEVMQVAWITPQRLLEAAAATPWAFSPWMVEQLPELDAGGWLR